MIDLTVPEAIRDIASIDELLARGVSRDPHRMLVDFGDGNNWSWEMARNRAHDAARHLAAQGLIAGQRLGLCLDNGPEFLALWWGAALIGVVVAPFNTALRGQMLTDICLTTDATLIVVEEHFLDRFDGVGGLDNTRLLTPDFLAAPAPEAPLPNHEYKPWLPHALIFTSGTTGPSKGSLNSFAHLFVMSDYLVKDAGLNGDDRLLVDLPMCHLAALTPILCMLSMGGSMVVRRVPAMSRYWEVAGEAGTTFATIVGTMAEFLLNQPESPHDRQHRMRFFVSSPLPSRIAEFHDRFGVEGFVTGYGSSECNVPLIMGLTTTPPPGTCGRLREGFEMRLVDDNDIPVPEGEIGEAILRSTVPWIMSLGYFNNPAATCSAWRNGWFHTGDNLRRDADGYYYFQDRKKDALRRRGENISSFEVEREVLTFPAVAEAACVPMASDTAGDDEVKIFVVLKPDAPFEFEALHRYLAARMPHYMVPRFYEVSENFSKTPSLRIRKFELIELGNSERTWDCEAAGLRVTRQGVAASG